MKERILSTKIAGFIGGVAALMLSAGLLAEDENYVNIEGDLGTGVQLQEVAERAFDNADDYWTNYPGPVDGDDEELSAGEAVTAIYTHARDLGAADPLAKDIVNVTKSVVDAWPDCQDTFDAVRSAVSLEPGRADEIVANIAVKRNCNCTNGGMWLDQRVDNRIRVEARHHILDVPVQCSCSQIAMYAGIAGLPENREFKPDMSEEEKADIIDRMIERVQVITDRTAALQSMNSWECGCTNINIAASMQGITEDELRDGTYDGLADKYAEDAAEKGLVVDAFGVVGMYPANHWGEGDYSSEENVLLRKTFVYRGDNMILDPFSPETEYSSAGYPNLGALGNHSITSDSIPTDLFISEYVEGWNTEALKQPDQDRDPEQRNRVLELFNGSDETIDLGNDQYFLEIYAGPGTPTRTVVTPPLLVKKTISLESDVVFEFDKADIKADASEDLTKVSEALNEVDFFSEILIVGHTCDIGSDEYNLQLSERRADSVRDFLQAAGLKDVEIRTEGHGEREPRLPNNSSANRSRNRRVDITFVTTAGEEIEATVTEAEPGAPKKYEYTFMVPIPPTVHDVESESAGSMAAGQYSEGDMDPRQVIGLNGAIEPGETWIIAYDKSDDVIKDKANVVTGQLDFQPNETLVVRRMGGEMALNCRAQSYAYIINYPPVPFVRYDDPIPPAPPDDFEVASPN
jgi:outer membrane protein OmpA-like peptidoglycan-associated protein